MTDTTWETDELYNWIANDEGLYHLVLGMTAEEMRQDDGVLYICQQEDIDPTLVDWDELAACISDMRTEHYLLGILDGWYDRSHRLGEENSKDAWAEWEPDYTEGYWYGWDMAGYLPDEQLNEGREVWRKRIHDKW